MANRLPARAGHPSPGRTSQSSLDALVLTALALIFLAAAFFVITNGHVDEGVSRISGEFSSIAGRMAQDLPH